MTINTYHIKCNLGGLVLCPSPINTPLPAGSKFLQEMLLRGYLASLRVSVVT